MWVLIHNYHDTDCPDISPEVLHEEALMFISIYKGALEVLLITFLRWKVLSKLASA